MQEAIANGVDPTPDYIETLLKYSARDTESPPTFEGYGVLDDTTMTTVLAHAAAGSLPARPDPDLNGIYVDTVMATLRDVSSNKLDSEAMVFVPTGLPIDSGPGRMSAGMEAGYVEGERYTVSAGAGERVTATLDGTEYPSLFSLYAYEGTGPTFSEPDLVAARSIGGENGATISFRSPDAEVYTVLAVGRFVPPGFPMLPFTLTATGSDGAQGIFDGEDLYATTTTFLGIPG
jgi:hypothetical protein